MEVTGSATQPIRVHTAACQQTEHDAFAAQLLSQNRQLMQIHKLVLGPKLSNLMIRV